MNLALLIVRQRLGQPPVHDLDLAKLADHHVSRLHVAMDDSAGMGESHYLAHLLEYTQVFCLIFAHIFPAAQQSFQGLPLYELHRDENTAVRQPSYIVNRRDSRVLQLPGNFSFLHKSANKMAIALQRALAGSKDEDKDDKSSKGKKKADKPQQEDILRRTLERHEGES